MPPKKRKGEENVSEISPSATPVIKRRRKGIQYDPAEICQEIFDVVRNHKKENGELLCESFLRMPKRRTDPEYYDQIENPIDFMKVQSKLKNEEYEDIDQMTDDFELLVKNAYMFYREDTQEYEDAKSLWSLYENRKTAILARVLGGESGTGEQDPPPEERAPVKMKISLTSGSSKVTTPAADSDETDEDDASEQVEQTEGDENKDGGDGDNEDEETEVEGADDETSRQSAAEALPKRRKRRKREVVETSFAEDETNAKTKPTPRPRGRPPKDSPGVKRRPGRPPKSSYTPAPELDDSVSQDSRDVDSPSVATEDDAGPYEELLAAVVNAKDGVRSLSEIFKILPPRESYPDYYDVIKEPIDLKTVAQKIHRNEYTSLDEMVKDLNLMCTNARAFNEPGSEVYKNAVSLRRVISDKRTELQSPRPTPTAAATRGRPRTRRGQPERLSATLAKLEFTEAIKIKLNIEPAVPETCGEEASETEGSVIDDLDSPLWALYQCIMNYKNNMGQQLCEPFNRLPNRKFYPDYYAEIERPISFLQIRSKIRHNKYKTLEALATGLDLMFENAKRYNVDDSKIHKDAIKLQSVMKAKYKELTGKMKLLGLAALAQLALLKVAKDESWHETPEVELKKGRRSMDTASVTSDDGSGTPKRKTSRRSTPEEQLRVRLWMLYKAVLDYKLDGRSLIDIFVTLPSKKEYPGYYQVISEPIDMSIIEHKIKHDKYTTTMALVQDMELMFNNARHFNQETSQVYKDAETLERIFKLKVRSLPPMPSDGSPVVEQQADAGETTLTQKLQQLYNTVKDYRDSHYRQLSPPFMHLPSRQEYPDYYDIIRKPIDLVRIQQKISGSQYANVEELAADFTQLFDNATKYNEPDSLIYRDALTLLRLCLEKKQQVIRESGDLAVPDVRSAVQELMTNLFIAVQNYADEEGRCLADSFQELPLVLEEPATAEGEKRTKRAAPSFARMKVNLDKGRYRRLDRFQEDLFQVFEFARRCSRSDSQLYEDAVELGMYFIKKRDEVCKNGETVITPALSYTERILTLAVEQERKRKLEEEAQMDDKKKEEQKPIVPEVKQEDESEVSFVYNDVTYAVGDFVYVEPREAALEHHIVVVENLYKDEKGEMMLAGNFFLKPQETFHHATRKFLQKEVFKSDKSGSMPLSKVLGKCYVMSVKEYFRMRPQGFEEKDIWVCESRYNSRVRFFKKIKAWSVPRNEQVQLVAREVALEPVRVRSVFAPDGSIELPPEDSASDVLDKDRQVVEQYVDMNGLATTGCRFFEQMRSLAGWFKIGDHVYIKDSNAQIKLTRIDRMWTDPAGVSYIQGPYYLNPNQVEHDLTRTFYERELLKSTVEDTHLLTAVMGRCMVMPLRDYLTCRLTEIPEQHVYVCESKYIEAEKVCKKFMKPSSMIKDNKLSIHVCDDEVYFFPTPITPLKVASPLLYQYLSRPPPPPPPEETEDSQALGFDESSNMMDASFGDSFVTALQDTSTQDSFGTSDATPKMIKRKGARKRRGAEEAGDRKKKGKASGYIMFAAEFRKEIMNEHKDAGFGEISKIVGCRWKALPKEERERYEAMARKQAEEARLKQEEAERLEALKAQAAGSPMRDTQSPRAPFNQQAPAGFMQHQPQFSQSQGFSPLAQQGQAPHFQQPYTTQPGMQPGLPHHPQFMQGQPQQPPPPPIYMHFPQPQQQPPQHMPRGPATSASGLAPGAVNGATGPQQQMGPPPAPAIQSPVFVTVPPRTQRLIHSDAYLKYIDNLQPDRPEISNWKRQLTANEDNTPLHPSGGKLPVEWLGPGAAHHQNAVSALWALRDLMMSDVMSLSRTLDYTEF